MPPSPSAPPRACGLARGAYPRVSSSPRLPPHAQLALAVPDKNTPVIFTCWGGGASRTASQLAKAAGYANVFNNYYGKYKVLCWLKGCAVLLDFSFFSFLQVCLLQSLTHCRW